MDLKKMHPKYELQPDQEKHVKESLEYVKALHVEEFMNVQINRLISTIGIIDPCHL